MKNTYNQKHLSLEDRRKIEEGIKKRLHKSEIAKFINKSPSTIPCLLLVFLTTSYLS